MKLLYESTTKRNQTINRKLEKEKNQSHQVEPTATIDRKRAGYSGRLCGHRTLPDPAAPGQRKSSFERRKSSLRRRSPRRASRSRLVMAMGSGGGGGGGSEPEESVLFRRGTGQVRPRYAQRLAVGLRTLCLHLVAASCPHPLSLSPGRKLLLLPFGSPWL
jgi:hypothetical protein